jgi:predicted transposase/invertase (TIGR01784 family)
MLEFKRIGANRLLVLDGINPTTIERRRGAGAYVLPSGLKTGIVVIHQLPQTPETLWFRLLGKDGVQKKAIEEVAKLPQGHPYRQNTLELLVNLKVTLEARTDIKPEDRELIMQLSPLYLEQLQAAKQEGEQQKQQEIAIKMLRENISVETIARITELSLEQIQQLRSSL